METEEHFFTASRKKIEEYVHDRILLVKLQAVEKTSQLAGKLFSVLIIGMLIFFILLFLSIMAGYLFAELTGSLYIGFGIVALVYIILLVVILKLRKSLIEKKVINEIIETVFDKGADAE